MTWLARHPGLLAGLVVLAAGFLTAYPLPTLTLAAMAAAFWGISTLHDNVTVTKARVRQRADYEHRLFLCGDPRGLYGRHAPYVIIHNGRIYARKP